MNMFGKAVFKNAFSISFASFKTVLMILWQLSSQIVLKLQDKPNYFNINVLQLQTSADF